MTNLEPYLIAYADQRIANTSAWLDDVITHIRRHALNHGPDDALSVCALSDYLDNHLTAAGAMSDALALALRRLAAQ